MVTTHTSSVLHDSDPQNEKMGNHDLGVTESHTVGEARVLERADAGTKRDIKSRHAQMIAIGGSIGTGLFVGSGQALAIAGPGFLFLSYCIMALMVYCVVTGVIEVATYLPVPGSSMNYYCSRYISPSLGFALGWLYFYSFGIILAYEITAAGIIINYWPNNVHIAVWITILMVVIVALNFSPVAVYAETEFWFASLKIIMVIGLLILSFILMVGGGPNHERLGFRYWNNPGATKAHLLEGSAGKFTSFLYVVVFSGFSFYFSPELIIVLGGEMRNPRKNLPIASNHFFYRLVFFYLLTSLAVGAICASNAKDLTSGSGNANASPFVIAIRNAGISGLPSVVNAGILTSAWSAGNSYLYMSSRSLYSLALTGQAPKIFTRCNRQGLPVYAVIAASCFAPLAYLSVGSQSGVVFNWFISLTNSAGYTSWIVCSVILIRFRKACQVQGVTPPYRTWIQPYGSWIAMVVFSILLLCNGFTVFYPGQWDTAGFVTTYVGIPLFLSLWLGHKVLRGRNDPWMLAPKQVDLTSDLSEVEADAEMWTRLDEESKANSKASGNKVWKKISVIWN